MTMKQVNTRDKLMLSWVFIILAIIFGLLNQVILVGFAGGIAAFWRRGIDRDLRDKLFKSRTWKVVAMIYLSILFVLALLKVDVLGFGNGFVFVLIFMLPVIIPMVRNDYKIIVSKSD